MSLNNYLSNVPKYIKLSLIGVFLLGFGTWQLFFLNTAFNIDIPKKVKNIFTPAILPNGFCKDCNVILISLDTLRAKSLPCYGYEKNTASNLCEFANKSFLFKNSFSTASKTLDSHFSIFTSLYPSSHKMNLPFVSVLGDDIYTLTQVLKKSGYSTYYLGGTEAVHLPLDKGLGRSFDKKINSRDPRSWIKNLKQIDLSSNKFFAFLHTYYVHDPYYPDMKDVAKFYDGELSVKEDLVKNTCNNMYKLLLKLHPDRITDLTDTSRLNTCEVISQYLREYAYISSDEYDKFYQANQKSYWDNFKTLPIEEKKKLIKAMYETKIYELDLELKDFFNFLDSSQLLQNTLVVVTADHGEEFYEHGGWGHASLYSEALKVPLIIYIPKSSSKTMDKLASTIDIYPSVLDLLGLSAPSGIQGMNLFSNKNHDYIIAEHVVTRLYSIITEKWQLIVNNSSKVNEKKELYDLINDTGEANNLTGQKADIENNLKKKLQMFRNSFPLPSKSNNPLPFPTWIDEEQKKKLIETGYF